MSNILLASAAGSPGVTTTAVGLTMAWHRSALLLETDITRHSAIIPGFLRGQIPHTRKISELAVTSSHLGSLDINQLWAQTVPLVTDGSNLDRRLLPGFSDLNAVPAMDRLWGQLASAAAATEQGGYDTIVDAGRWLPADRRAALIDHADLVVFLVRPHLSDVIAAMAVLPSIRDQLARLGREDALMVQLMEVAEGPRRDKREIRAALGLDPIDPITFDPRAAAVFSAGTKAVRSLDKMPYGRTLASSAGALRRRLQEQKARLERPRNEPEAIR